MTDHSSKARISPGKPLSTTQVPVLTPQFNHHSLMRTAPDKTISHVTSDAVAESSSRLNNKKLIS